MSPEETERITIMLQARDRDFHRALDRSNKLLAKFEKDATRATTRQARTVEKNLASVGTSLKVFAGGLLGSALVVGADMAISKTREVVKGVAAIGDEARRSGLGVEKFQELSFVAQQTRIPVDAMIDGMKELSLRADEFVVTGKGPAAEAFARLGYGSADLARKLKDPGELMLEIIGRMEDMDRAAQIRIADEVFGGTGGERFVELLAQGEGGVRGIIDRAHELGLVMDKETIAKAQELDRKFGEITARVSTLAKTIVVNLAGAIDEALRVDVDDIFGNAERAIAMLGDENYRALKGQPELVKDQEEAVRDLQGTYEELFRLINAATGPDGFRLMDVADLDAAHELSAILSDLDAEMRAFQTGQTNAEAFEAAMGDLIVEAEDVISQLDQIDASRMTGVIGQVQALATALATAAKNAAAARAALPAGDEGVSFTTGPGSRPNNRPPSPYAPTKSLRPQLPSVDSFPTAPSSRGGGGGDVAAYRREVEATRDAIAELEAEAMSMMAAAQYGREVGDAMEFARKRAELLVAAQREGKAITPELTSEIDKLALAYVEAGMNAEDAADRMDRVKDAAERGGDAISDIFLSVLDSSRNAKDAVADLLMEIAKVQIFNGFRSLAGGGGLFGFLGDLLTRRAIGGPAEAFRPYLVNENTPRSEVFVPSRSGGVLSVPQAQAALRDHAMVRAPRTVAVTTDRGGQKIAVDVRLAVPEGVTVEQATQIAGNIAVRVSQATAQRQNRALPTTMRDKSDRYL